MENQNWQPVHGFEGLYEINESSAVRSLHKTNYNNLLNTRIDRGGYLTVRLSKNGITSTKLVHRLLAETFIPNLRNEKYVNHKDGNKLNNSLSNLECVTHAENMRHAYYSGSIKLKAKPVVDACSGK